MASTRIPLTPEQIAQAFFSATENIDRFGREIILPQLMGLLKPNPLDQAVTTTFGRMHAWMETLGKLNDPMHYQAVSTGARSLFELLMDLALLLSDQNGERLNRFLWFPEVEKYRVATTLDRVLRQCPDPEDLDPDTFSAFLAGPGRSQAVAHLRRKGWNGNSPRHWSGEKVKDRAALLGGDYTRLYDRLYAELSWHIHAGAVGTAGVSRDGFHAFILTAHRHSQVFYVRGVRLLASHFHLYEAVPGLAERLRELLLLPGFLLLKAELTKPPTDM